MAMIGMMTNEADHSIAITKVVKLIDHDNHNDDEKDDDDDDLISNIHWFDADFTLSTTTWSEKTIVMMLVIMIYLTHETENASYPWARCRDLADCRPRGQ